MWFFWMPVNIRNNWNINKLIFIHYKGTIVIFKPLVWALKECINVGSPDCHVTTSISWLVYLGKGTMYSSMEFWYTDLPLLHNTPDYVDKLPIQRTILHTYYFDKIFSILSLRHICQDFVKLGGALEIIKYVVTR